MAAAIASARQSIPTLLLETHSQPGGTVARVLLHTIAGLYDHQGELLNDALPAELVERLQQASSEVAQRKMGSVYVLNVAPDIYQSTTQSWLESEPHLHLLFQSKVVEVQSADNQVTEVTIQTPQGQRKFQPSAVIDCTGTGELVSLIAPDVILDDENRSAGGLVVRLTDIKPGTMAFPKGIGIVRSLRDAATREELPEDCQHAWIDTGVAPDEVYLKLFVPISGEWFFSPEECSRIEAAARETALQAVDFLKSFPEFQQARVAEIGALGVRDGGRIQGEYLLTAEDVRAGKTFSDGVCRCHWPIEYWHPREGIQLENLPEDSSYEIPLRALTLKGWGNVFMAGKCLSADHLAQASARVVGTCWAMGEAVGRTAAGLATEVTSHES